MIPRHRRCDCIGLSEGNGNEAGGRHLSRNFIDVAAPFPYAAPYVAGGFASAASPGGQRLLFSTERILLFFILHPIV
jgi:hypothetical protein